jgi:tripeptidyl-peptidase-1
VFNESSTTDPSEGNGDIQVTLGLTHSSVFNIFYLAGGTLKNDHPDHQVTADLPLEPWSEFLDSMLKIGETAMQGGKNRWTNGLPHTLSISFGENEQNIPKSYAEVVCNKFARLGSMGVSILAASGDYQPTTECETNGNPSKTWLIPAFPAGCPAITSVGATHVEGNEEIGADFSAGGFSDYFPRPDYQKNHRGIDNYLKSQSAVSLRSWYNPNGRAYPDVSAVGTDIWMLSNRKLTNFCGASASAPVFASAIALLNAKRLEDNKAPLGFLNPWLYKEGDAMLRDITRGNAVGCRYHRSNAMLRNLGTWKSTPGWDAVTGLGVPRYDKMVQRLP